ncbi:MAG: DUF4249 family protein [Candidatus Handelsmanbacteria bacterium]|nr:DUF4249 family protein [Candidatus Handelsmanbacteria bacterium]
MIPCLLFLALLALSCSNPTEVESPPPALLVQAYLTPGEDPRVTLRHTLAPNQYYTGRENPVSGAQVEVTSQGQRYLLPEDPAEPGAYLLPAAQLPIESGRTYQLQVRHRQDLLQAATTVPDPVRITEISADSVVYFQLFGDLFGDLTHPGEFRWTKPVNAAGYVVRVESMQVRTLYITAEPLTGDLDTLLAWRQRLQGLVSADSLAALDRRIADLRGYFSENVTLLQADGDTLRWLRDREQQDWDEIEGKDWTDGRKWRERRQKLDQNRVVSYWIPADTLRGDYWWAGLRFEGEYQVVLQAADQNYFDYFTTAFNGLSGDDGDKGPLLHVEGGLGLFGSYTEDSFRVQVYRGSQGQPKLVVRR